MDHRFGHVVIEMPSNGCPIRLRSTTIDPERLARAKTAYTTRRVQLGDARLVLQGVTPRAGDVVLARVLEIGQHQHLESGAGRRARLWPGDEIVVAYGNRYAPDQFEAYVPADLDACHLVAGGGVAARATCRHKAMRGATAIEPVGLLAYEDGRRMNLMDRRIAAPHDPARATLTIAVLGSTMNAGKTTTCAAITRGLRACGFRVGAAKVTGTGSGGDRWAQIDAGAEPMLDFTDAGYASTFGLDLPELEDILKRLTGSLASHGVDAIVIEIADGLLQRETSDLASSDQFASSVNGIVFAAANSLGAVAGVDWLRQRRLPVLAVSGVVTASPLGAREAAAATGLPVIGPEDLASGVWLADTLGAPGGPLKQARA